MNIPDYCYTLNNITIDPKTKIGEIIKIKALESGYYRTIKSGTQEDVDQLNKKLGVTRAQEEAMSTGSMFGWETYLKALETYQEKCSEENGISNVDME